LAAAGAPARVPPRQAAAVLQQAADLRRLLEAAQPQRAAGPEQDLEPALPKQSPAPAPVERLVPPA
jgi:hypothetical protein